MGIIDTLSAGFYTISRRLWLIAPPVLVDLYLWRGPRLSMLPLVRQMTSLLQTLPESDLSGVSPAAVSSTLEQVGQDLNLFSLLHSGLSGMPSLIAWAASEFGGDPAGVIEIRSWGALLVAFAVLLLLGIFIGTLYLFLLASAIRQEILPLREAVRRIWHVWVWIVMWGILILGLALSVSLLISMATVPVALISQPAAQGLFGALWLVSIGLGLWLALNTFFTVQALVLQDVGLPKAVWRSFNVVRRSFWATVGLILLSLVIQLGFGQIWQWLDNGPWEKLLSIVGNAYIGSGVTAAIMIFYMDRYRRWWEAQRAEALSRVDEEATRGTG